MVKKIGLLICSVFLYLSFTLNVNAVTPKASNIYDFAEIFSQDAINKADEIIDETMEKYKVPMFVYTSYDNIQSAEYSADNLLYSRVGKDQDGFLVYINMNTRDLHVTYSGKVIEMISDDRRDDLLDTIAANLSNAEYDKAMLDSLNKASDYIAGGPIPGINVIEKQGLSVKDAIGAAGGGIVTFFLSLTGLKAKSKSRPSKLVYSLLDNSKADFGNEEDVFIGTQTRSRIIPVVSSSRGSSRSGRSTSTTHRGSGGGSFGGGGRKF